jgi:hypothetical protein
MVEGFGADDGIILEPQIDADVGQALPQATRINPDEAPYYLRLSAFICGYTSKTFLRLPLIIVVRKFIK